MNLPHLHAAQALDESHGRRFPRLSGWVAVLILALVVLILFLPLGFNVGFVVDGWAFYDKHNAARQLGALPPGWNIRPFVDLVWAVVFTLDPWSFVASNVILYVLLLSKGLLVRAILMRLTADQALALAAGLLSVLVPADSGIFYLGALAIHLAVFCWLAATWSLLVFFHSRRISAALLVGIMLAIACGIYEITFLVLPVGLLALWAAARRAGRRWDHGFWLSAAVYCAVPIFMAVRYAVLWLNQPVEVSYQQELLDQGITLLDMLTTLSQIYLRHFFGAWWAEGAALAGLAMAALAGTLAGVGIWFQARSEASGGLSRQNPHWAFAITGLLLIALGVAAYLPTTERDSTMRVFYFSVLGAALAIAVTLSWITGRLPPFSGRLAFALGTAALTLLGSARLLEQREQFQQTSSAQQAFLRATIKALPQLKPPVAVFILDTPGTRSVQDIFANTEILRSAMSLIYDTFEVVGGYCPTEPMPGVWCEFGSQSATQMLNGSPSIVTNYDRLIVLRFDGEALHVQESLQGIAPETPREAYAPYRLIDLNAPPPRRAVTMIGAQD